jgi:hypothetical protein
VSVGVEVIVTSPTVGIILVTVVMDGEMESEASGAPASIVIGVEVVMMVVMMVVGVSDTVTIAVDNLVSVTGGIVFGDSVTVCVESLVIICVSGGATPVG